MAEELKQSCTNVMLQCIPPQNRVTYILGVMFRVDSKICSEILGMTPEAYRKKLSRIKKQVGEFLGEYCGITSTGKCNCKKRIGYAIQTKRLNPRDLEYSNMKREDEESRGGFLAAMEKMDQLSLAFAQLPHYRAPKKTKKYIEVLIHSNTMQLIRREKGEK